MVLIPKDESEPRYEMRVIANRVEYFDLTRDRAPEPISPSLPMTNFDLNDLFSVRATDKCLADCLWLFDGHHLQGWPDVPQLLKHLTPNHVPSPVSIIPEFYPTSLALKRGLVFGLEAEISWAKELAFTYAYYSLRSEPFISPLLRHFILGDHEHNANLLVHCYERLPYFSQSLEILLHNILDEAGNADELGRVLSFFQKLPCFLDVMVQCTRKTDSREWPRLFEHLPAPRTLWDMALQAGRLQTASAYLLVLQTLQANDETVAQCIQLLKLAQAAEDWDLCQELATFLISLDSSGENLKKAVESMVHADPKRWATADNAALPAGWNVLQSPKSTDL